MRSDPPDHVFRPEAPLMERAKGEKEEDPVKVRPQPSNAVLLSSMVILVQVHAHSADFLKEIFAIP